MHNLLSEVPNGELFQWRGSHSDFVTVATILAGMTPGGFRAPDIHEKIDAMGEVLLKVIHIDIAPYPDFKSMHEAVPPSIELVLKMMDIIEKKIVFNDMIEDTGVEASEETQIDDLISTLMGYEMVRRLSPYVQFTSGDDNGAPWLGHGDQDL